MPVRASLGAAPEVEPENGFWRVRLESMRVLEENAREVEHLNAMTLEGEAMAELRLVRLPNIISLSLYAQRVA